MKVLTNEFNALASDFTHDERLPAEENMKQSSYKTMLA